MKKTGTAIILSGPSGVGKSTLVAAVRRMMPELEFSVSCTTRPPRTGEVDHVHYHFLSDDAFLRHIEAGDFLEHAGVFARRYGTLRSEVFDRVSRGIDVVLDIDVQGAMQIRKACESDPDLNNACEFVFLSPPSPEELERRLRKRGTETEEAIQRRLNNAKWEMEQWQHYDYLLINHDLDDAVNEFIAMIQTFRNKSKRLTKGI